MTTLDDTQTQSNEERETARRHSLRGGEPPAEISGYTIARRLGIGAFGSVWLAREDRTGRMVAIKFYAHRRGLDWSLLNREVEKLATLYTSRHIVGLLDVGWNGDLPYYVMEYVENGSLGSFLSGGPLSVNESLRMIREVCHALVDAHGAGILHCDLKPDNVLLDAQFGIRLCDFGQSRLSHEQSPALGTMYYMAPEQADLEALPDARWDVYAIGALLYQMLTGSPPHKSDQNDSRIDACEALPERLAAYQAIVHEQPAPVAHRNVRGVDRRLADIINQCLAPNAADRLPNAQAVVDQLDVRDRRRARRPMLTLGVIGPILLLAAMLPIFLSALQSNLTEMTEQLTDRALHSDAQSARILAGYLQDELDDLFRELRTVRDEQELAEELEQTLSRDGTQVASEFIAVHNMPPESQPRWVQLLEAARARADARNADRNREKDTSWFLTDATGVQVWRSEFDTQTVGVNYAWRDYFHGRNVELDPNHLPDDLRAIKAPHVSIAFRSQATDRYMVALSIPVHDSSGSVIGVFARTIHLGELQSHLVRRIQGSGDARVRRVISLIDARTWQVLDHPWLSSTAASQMFAANNENELDELFRHLRLGDEIVARLAASRDSTTSNSPVPSGESDFKLPDYSDPVGTLPDPSAQVYGIDWMASISAVDPWMVVVQEDRNAALQPVNDMTSVATTHAWLAVFVSLVMIGIVWLLVLKALDESPVRRMDSAGNARSGAG